MLDGRRAYHIGNICDTCSFFFERLEGANRSLGREEKLIAALHGGMSALCPETVEALGRFLPPDAYTACLLESTPVLVRPGDASDYFCREEIELWGVDSFWDLPHDPRTEYYRLGSRPIGERRMLHEFLVPMFPKRWLDAPRVAEYIAQLQRGDSPTALAVAVLDVKQPADWEGEPAVTEHWCLAHYLLDGHHKTCAAAQAGKPLTLLSFLATTQGVSSEEQCLAVIQALVAPYA